MVRIAKKQQLKKCPRKRHYKLLIPKTGTKADELAGGFKSHDNAVAASHAKNYFFPKLKAQV